MNICVNFLKMSIQNNKKGFIVKNTKANTNILKSFLKLNIIKFIILKNKKILVFINYKNNKPIFKNIINLHRPGNKLFINYKNLKKINYKHNWLFLLSTSKGILNSLEALNLKIGGLLIAKIWN